MGSTGTSQKNFRLLGFSIVLSVILFSFAIEKSFANPTVTMVTHYAKQVIAMSKMKNTPSEDFEFTCRLMKENFDIDQMLKIFKRAVGTSSEISPQLLLGFLAAFSLNRTDFAHDLRAYPNTIEFKILETKQEKKFGLDSTKLTFQLRNAADAPHTTIWAVNNKIIDLTNTNSGTMLVTGAGEISKRSNSNGSFIGALRAMQEYIREVVRDERVMQGCSL